MKTIFLTLLFATNTGQIISGNELDGWGDRPHPTMEACLERSRYLYKHPPALPQGFKAMVSYCIEREGYRG